MIFPVQYPENFTPSREARNLNERNAAERSFTFRERTIANRTLSSIIADAKSVLD